MCGRLPEDEYEIILEGYEDDYYIQTLARDMQEKTVYLTNMYTGEIEETVKMKIVGIKYLEPDRFYYSNTKIYLSDTMLEDIRFQINQNYSTVRVLFLNKYYDSVIYNPQFRVLPNSKVPEGVAYVSRDLNSYTSNGSCINKTITIEAKNLYYQEELTLKISKTYTKNNMKSLLGIKDYEYNNGTIYISNEDYNKLFNKDTYQISIFVENTEAIKQTVSELEALGLKTFVMRDTLVNSNATQIVEIFQTIVTIILIIALFFITYFIIKIILKSRNIYFSTLRMLGANKKISKQLLIIELLVVSNSAYAIFIVAILLQNCGIINLEFIQIILDYLKISDYALLYVTLMLMSYIISLKYAKKLFKESTITTYNEEV